MARAADALPHLPTRTADGGVSLWPTVTIGLVLVGEVAAEVFLVPDAGRAALLSVLVAGALFAALMRSLVMDGPYAPRSLLRLLAVLSPVLFVTVYGYGVAAARGNDAYYVAADLYHLILEICVMALLTVWVLHRRTERDLQIMIVGIGLATGGVALCGSLLGATGLVETGGHFVESVGLWRMFAGRGFPLVPLALCTALLASGRVLPSLRPWLWLATGILFIDLVLALKRAMWLTYVGILPILFWRAQTLRVLIFAGMIALPAAIAATILRPDIVLDVFYFMNSLLTYNPNYTILDTLMERYEQIELVAGYLFGQPWGHGLGAEFLTYWPGENTYGYVHYIHNLYVYYLLQLGYLGCLLLFASFAIVLWMLWRRLDRDPELDWATRASFAAILCILVPGVTMVSLHSAFAGFVVGLGVWVTSRPLPRA